MAEQVQQKQDFVDFNKQNKSKFSNIQEICRSKRSQIDMEENEQELNQQLIYDDVNLEELTFGLQQNHFLINLKQRYELELLQNIDKLIKEIKENPDRITYNLGMKKLTIKAIKEIALSFKFTPNLAHLNLHIELNEITDQGITYIAQGISQLPNLQSLALYCGWSKIGQQGITNLGESLSKYCPNIARLELYLSRSWRIAQSMEQLALLIQNLQYLSVLVLYLWENKINDNQIKYLCEGLEQCVNLDYLKLLLGNNDIGEQGVISIGNSIKQIPKITSLMLDLSETQINGVGMRYLGQKILESQNLNYLEIKYNDNPNIIGEQRLIGQMKKQIIHSKRMVKITY